MLEISKKQRVSVLKKALEWHEKHGNGEEDLNDKPRSGASMPIMEGPLHHYPKFER